MISAKRLESAFPGKGKELRAVLTGEKKTREYKSVQDLERSCHHGPDTHYRRMTALNEILEGYGIEAVWNEGEGPNDCISDPRAEYINMGDTYTTTILFDFQKGKYFLTTWGDFVESMEG